jgi:hypothetical protein
MKKLILFTSLLISTNVFADELHNFDQIKAAVLTGKTIHIAIDFSKCCPQNKVAEQMSIGIFTPNTLQVTNHTIATSLTHLTLNNPRFPDKPVYEFARYTITADNQVNLMVQVLDATNYTPLTNKFSLNCKIDTDAKIYD